MNYKEQKSLLELYDTKKNELEVSEQSLAYIDADKDPRAMFKEDYDELDSLDPEDYRGRIDVMNRLIKKINDLFAVDGVDPWPLKLVTGSGQESGEVVSSLVEKAVSERIIQAEDKELNAVLDGLGEAGEPYQDELGQALPGEKKSVIEGNIARVKATFETVRLLRNILRDDEIPDQDLQKGIISSIHGLVDRLADHLEKNVFPRSGLGYLLKKNDFIIYDGLLRLIATDKTFKELGVVVDKDRINHLRMKLSDMLKQRPERSDPKEKAEVKEDKFPETPAANEKSSISTEAQDILRELSLNEDFVRECGLEIDGILPEKTVLKLRFLKETIEHDDADFLKSPVTAKDFFEFADKLEIGFEKPGILAAFMRAYNFTYPKTGVENISLVGEEKLYYLRIFTGKSNEDIAIGLSGLFRLDDKVQVISNADGFVEKIIVRDCYGKKGCSLLITPMRFGLWVGKLPSQFPEPNLEIDSLNLGYLRQSIDG